jgi:hypothetical protein
MQNVRSSHRKTSLEKVKRNPKTTADTGEGVMEAQGDEKVYELWLGHEKITATYSEIKANPILEADLKKLEQRKLECGIAFFHPHGDKKRAYDCGFDVVSTADWINDRTHDLYMNQSPNQVGKTCHAVAKAILMTIPCDKTWPIFQNGIKYYDWDGEKTLVAMGYDKSQLREDLWPELQKWLPASELGDFRSITLGGTRDPSWDRGPRVPLKCGSKIILLTYDQLPSVCCGVKADIVLANEQIPVPFFMELSQRGRTRGGVKFIMSYTPHIVPGRPDSGMNSFLVGLWRGSDTYGRSILRTRISIDDVPDHIIHPEEKHKAFVEHVENPKKTGNQSAIREGMARYYGIAQEASGLFYPEIERDIHYVDWEWKDIAGKGWTCYRSMDYGYQNPTACGMWAASPSGELFMFDEYYRTGLDAIGHAPAIIEHCGNERKLIKKMFDKDTGNYWDCYEEIAIRQRYVRTWLDWHSFQTAGGIGRPVSFFFQIGGLNVCESSKLGQEARAQNLRALLKIDPMRKHMVTGKLGAPRMYFSRKCTKMIWEFERCVVDTRAFGNESKNLKETKRNRDDHLVDATEYLASESPRFLGDYSNRKPKELQNISNHGGY